MATGPLTWKNVQSTGSGAILDAINNSAKLVGTGITGISDAFTNYADQRSTRETDALEASLLAAGDEAGRQAVMQGQDMSFIDQARLNDIEKKRQDAALEEAKWFTRQEQKTDDTIRINNNKPSKRVNVHYGKDPLNNVYKDLYGEDDGFWSILGLGSGYDQDDKDEFSQYRSKFLAKHPDISAKQFNEHAKDRVSFSDEFWNDRFIFQGNDSKEYDFSNFGKSENALYDSIVSAKSKGEKASDTEKNTSDQFKKFYNENGGKYKNPFEAWEAFNTLNSEK